MGRIKTKLVKRISQKVLAEHPGVFTDNYLKNKELLPQFLEVHSTKNNNVIAGYLTKLVKKRKVEA